MRCGSQWEVRQNRQEITIKEKDTRKWYFVDVLVPQDHHIAMKENGKINKYLELAEKAQTEHHVKFEIIPILLEQWTQYQSNLKYQTP